MKGAIEDDASLVIDDGVFGYGVLTGIFEMDAVSGVILDQVARDGDMARVSDADRPKAVANLVGVDGAPFRSVQAYPVIVISDPVSGYDAVDGAFQADADLVSSQKVALDFRVGGALIGDSKEVVCQVQALCGYVVAVEAVDEARIGRRIHGFVGDVDEVDDRLSVYQV